MFDYPETHQQGHISVENDEVIKHYLACHQDNDLGIQIARDGRIWLCVNGVSWIRFSPHLNRKMVPDGN